MMRVKTFYALTWALLIGAVAWLTPCLLYTSRCV